MLISILGVDTMNDETVNLLNALELLYDGAMRYIEQNNIKDIEVTNARNNLRGFILGSDVKPIYEYKLKPDTKAERYFDAGLKTFSKNGKSWGKQNHLNAAITTWINDVHIWRELQPHPGYTKEIRNGKSVFVNTPEYDEWETLRQKARTDKEFRASLIPIEWTVIAIPINTRGEIKEINAREFYLGEK